MCAVMAIVYSIICHIYKYDHYRLLIEYINKTNPEIIKVLQEIACDYRVRVIKAGKGYIKADIIKASDIERKCINLANDNSSPGYNFKFDDDSKLYLINFRVFGKCYLAYSDNEVDAWSLVVSKAREESRNLFGRSGYLDRHKIQ